MKNKFNKSKLAFLRKIVKYSAIFTVIFSISIFTIGNTINSSANDNINDTFINPEAVLNITFKDGVYLDNIIENELNPNKNWQGMKFDDDFGITNLSGISNIGGIEEKISVLTQSKINNIKKIYKSKLRKTIQQVDSILESNENLENKDNIINNDLRSELNKMSRTEVKNQIQYNWSQSKILSIGIVGKTKTLKTIRNILEKSEHTYRMSYIEAEELNKIKNEFEKDTIELSEVDKESYYLNKISKEINDKNENTNLEQSINKFVIENNLLLKDSFNTQILKDSEILNKAENEKISFSNLFNLKSHASNYCQREGRSNKENDGIKIIMNKCLAENLMDVGNMLSYLNWMLSPFVLIFPIGTYITKLVLLFVSSNLQAIGRESRNCGNSGLSIKIKWFGLVRINGCN